MNGTRVGGAFVFKDRSRHAIGLFISVLVLVAIACGDSGTGTAGTPVDTTTGSSTILTTTTTLPATTTTLAPTTTTLAPTTTTLAATTTTRGPVTCENDVIGFTLLVPDPWNVRDGATPDLACREVSKPFRSGSPIIVEAYPGLDFPQGFAFLRDSDDKRAMLEYNEYTTPGGVDAISAVQEIIDGPFAGRQDLWIVIDGVPPIALFVAVEDLDELEEIQDLMAQLAGSIVTG